VQPTTLNIDLSKTLKFQP